MSIADRDLRARRSNSSPNQRANHCNSIDLLPVCYCYCQHRRRCRRRCRRRWFRTARGGAYGFFGASLAPTSTSLAALGRRLSCTAHRSGPSAATRRRRRLAPVESRESRLVAQRGRSFGCERASRVCVYLCGDSVDMLVRLTWDFRAISEQASGL